MYYSSDNVFTNEVKDIWCVYTIKLFVWVFFVVVFFFFFFYFTPDIRVFLHIVDPDRLKLKLVDLNFKIKTKKKKKFIPLFSSFLVMSCSMSMCVCVCAFLTVFQHSLFSCVCHLFPLSYHFISLYFPPIFSGLRVAAASSSFPTETSFSCGTQRDRSASESRWCNTTTVTSMLCSSCTTSPARPASAA